jgi:alpha-beta hydrolase superfamily lysophospholipase
MSSQNPYNEWDQPEGLNPRGTLVVLPGRGEQPGLYRRFGSRLAADAYQVRAVGDATVDVEAVSAQVKDILGPDGANSPKVLIGSDSGALLAVRLVASGSVEVDALVLAGLPDLDTDISLEPEEERQARASCPTHRGLLRDSGMLEYGALTADRIPEALRQPVDLSAVRVPVLAVHGADDAIYPVESARKTYAGLPNVQLITVADGRHDVLNAINHRSVAASVVLFLERLRLGSDLPAIIRSEELP